MRRGPCWRVRVVLGAGLAAAGDVRARAWLSVRAGKGGGGRVAWLERRVRTLLGDAARSRRLALRTADGTLLPRDEPLSVLRAGDTVLVDEINENWMLHAAGPAEHNAALCHQGVSYTPETKRRRMMAAADDNATPFNTEQCDATPLDIERHDATTHATERHDATTHATERRDATTQDEVDAHTTPVPLSPHSSHLSTLMHLDDYQGQWWDVRAERAEEEAAASDELAECKARALALLGPSPCAAPPSPSPSPANTPPSPSPRRRRRHAAARHSEHTAPPPRNADDCATELADVNDRALELLDVNGVANDKAYTGQLYFGEERTRPLSDRVGRRRRRVRRRRAVASASVLSAPPQSVNDRSLGLVDPNARALELVDANSRALGLVDANSRALGLVDANDRALELFDANDRALELVYANDRALELVDANDRALELVEANDRALELVDANDRALELVDVNDRALELVDANRQAPEHVDANGAAGERGGLHKEADVSVDDGAERRAGAVVAPGGGAVRRNTHSLSAPRRVAPVRALPNPNGGLCQA